MNKIKAFEKELEWILNAKIREFTKIAVEGLPDYFFEVAASSTGKYHPPYALGSGGLVRHTKAALKIANDLLSLEMFSNKYNGDDRDLIIVALMLHDGLKHGKEYSKYTVAEHPVVAAEYVKEVDKDNILLTEEQVEKLSDMIASHMGQWNTNKYKKEIMPKPKNGIQMFVHLCDYLASRRYLDVDFDGDYYKYEEDTE